MARSKKEQWIHCPEGWQKERHVTLTSAQRKRIRAKTGRYQTHRRETMRGKQRCQHTEYILNRLGKPMIDPDDKYGGYARLRCNKIAHWEHFRIVGTLPGLGTMTESTRYCDKHAAKLGAK